MTLAYAAKDAFIFTNEETEYVRGKCVEPLRKSHGAGHSETMLFSDMEEVMNEDIRNEVGEDRHTERLSVFMSWKR